MNLKVVVCFTLKFTHKIFLPIGFIMMLWGLPVCAAKESQDFSQKRETSEKLLDVFLDHQAKGNDEQSRAFLLLFSQAFFEELMQDPSKKSRYEKNIAGIRGVKKDFLHERGDSLTTTLLDILMAGTRKTDFKLSFDYAKKTEQIVKNTRDFTSNAKLFKQLGEIFELHSPLSYAQLFFETALKSYLPHEYNDQAIVNNKLAIVHYMQADYSAAKLCLINAIKSAELAGNGYEQSSALSNLGAVHTKMGNMQEALKHYLKGYRLKSKVDPKGATNVLISIGNLYLNRGLYAEGLKYYFEAYEIKKRENDRHGMAVLLNNIGQGYYELFDYEKSHRYLLEALESKKGTSSQMSVARTMLNLSETMVKLDSMKVAIDIIKESIKIREVFGNDYDNSMAWLIMGKTMLEADSVESAEGYLEDAYATFMDIEARSKMAETRYAMGCLEMKKGNYNKALIHLDSALVMSKVMELRPLIQEIYLLQLEMYKQTGSLDKALDAQTNYYAARDSIFSVKNSLIIARIETQSELQKKDSEIVLLEANEENGLIYRIVWACFAVIATLLAIIVYFFFKRRITFSHKSLESAHAQTDRISSQSMQLQKANMEIKNINSTLEEKIAKRTAMLQERNEKLTAYIHSNSHIVRAPVSRLLGLINLYESAKEKEVDQEFIYQNIKQSILELDCVLKEINETLDFEKE